MSCWMDWFVMQGKLSSDVLDDAQGECWIIFLGQGTLITLSASLKGSRVYLEEKRTLLSRNISWRKFQLTFSISEKF